MRKRYIMIGALLLAFASATTFAQIPNSGFEDWSMIGNCLQPQGWACINDWMGSTENCYSMAQSEDHYPSSVGSYSMQIKNDISVLPDAGAYGMVWTGDTTGFGTDQPVFSITGHPTSLCGYYKFLPQNGDTMDIHFSLYKNGIEVTGGRLMTTATVSAWTSFIIPVTNPSYAEADSARIMMSTFYTDGGTVHGNSILYVDNLSFDALITSAVLEISDDNRIVVHQNPAGEEITFTLDINIGQQNELKMFNALGQQIFARQIGGMTQLTLNTARYPAGMYFVCLTTNEHQSYVRKIVISK